MCALLIINCIKMDEALSRNEAKIAILHWQSHMDSRDRGMEPWYPGLADSSTRPITSRSQLSIMIVLKYPMKTNTNEHLNIHKCDREPPKLTDNIFTTLFDSFDLYFDLLVWFMSHPLTWRRYDLWPILQPATRWWLRHSGFTFCELSCCPS